MDMHEVVGALKYLEAKFGTSPSVKEIADYLGCSPATAQRYLTEARDKEIITQKRGQFMTLDVARAFGKGSKS